MASVELDSFFQKFRCLVNDGVNATFNVQCENGKAVVSITAEIGLHINQHPFQYPSYADATRQYSGSGRSPSYFRRQARRREEHKHNNTGSTDVLNAMTENCNKTDAEQASIVEQNVAAVSCGVYYGCVSARQKASAEKAVQNSEHAVVVEQVSCPLENRVEAGNEATEKYVRLKREETTCNAINENGFSCKDCQYWCLLERDFRTHMATKHGATIDMDNSQLRRR